jgi:hypothetical protein
MATVHESLQLTRVPITSTGMLIRRPVADVFEALVNPAITSQFWFTRAAEGLRSASRSNGIGRCTTSRFTSPRKPSSRTAGSSSSGPDTVDPLLSNGGSRPRKMAQRSWLLQSPVSQGTERDKEAAAHHHKDCRRRHPHPYLRARQRISSRPAGPTVRRSFRSTPQTYGARCDIEVL